MHQDFSVEAVRQIFGGPIFEGRNEIFLFGKAIKFGVIFQKRVIKINKTLKNYREKLRKMQIVPIFLFLAGLWEKEYNIDRQ